MIKITVILLLISVTANSQRVITNATLLNRGEILAARAAPGANTDISSFRVDQGGMVQKGASSNALTFKVNETLSAERILNFIVNDASRTINLTGNLTVPSAATVSGTNTGDNAANSTYSNVNNTSDANKPVSTAQQTALDLKANLASPTFTGTVVLPNSTVTNAMLAGSIAYSKLSLTGAVLNADLAGSIAYSKLSLTGAILNADLAGSIAASKLVGSDIATVGTIGTGTWQGTVVGSTYGGTGVNNGGRTLTQSTNSGTIAFPAASTTHTFAANSSTVVGKVATADIAATASATSTTTLFTPTVSGMYRLSIYLKISTTGTSPVAGPVTITYTEPDGSVGQSHVMLLQNVSGAVVTTTVNNSTTTGTVNGSMIFNAKTGVAIQYAIAVSGTFGAGRYIAHIVLEAL